MAASGTIAPTKVGGGRFVITEALGAGSFGAVYRGLDTETDEPVAVKVEDGRTGQLQRELEVLQMLQGDGEHGRCQGFAKILCYARIQKGERYALVMEYFSGSLLNRLKDSAEGRFSVQTACLLAPQMLSSLQLLHSKGVVHRDIKPDNFMMGVGPRRHHVYLIDFGLAEFYCRDGVHATMKREDAFQGTLRYASVNSQLYFSQGRRDDLEALVNVMVFSLRGELPWMHVDAESQADLFRQVREIKADTPPEVLCEGLPKAFQQLAAYVHCLGYQDRPDFELMRGFFAELRSDLEAEHGKIEDHAFDWEDASASAEPLEAVLLQKDVVRMPDEPCRRCPGCCNVMFWTTSRQGVYEHGWACDMKFRCTGQIQTDQGRWNCTGCRGDFCTTCIDSPATAPVWRPVQAPPVQSQSCGFFGLLFGCGGGRNPPPVGLPGPGAARPAARSY